MEFVGREEFAGEERMLKYLNRPYIRPLPAGSTRKKRWTCIAFIYIRNVIKKEKERRTYIERRNGANIYI